MEKGSISPIFWKNGKLVILDQTKLPNREIYRELGTKEEVYDAIKTLAVRGAPAIGDCAAYGLFVSARNRKDQDLASFLKGIREDAEYLNSSRPTAVNLSWALKREVHVLEDFARGKTEEGKTGADVVEDAKEILLEEAHKIWNEDVESCRSMGEYGLSLLKPGMGILTHCNAGALATAKYGTCLSPVYLGEEQGYGFKVFSDETRPLLQGARLTAWELHRAGIDVTTICDNMASIVMKNGWIDAVVVGCDRMAANGDGANKIGTSGVAILAKEYGIPFYMYVPTSTIDLNTETGADIPIEEREGAEIREMWYREPMAPEGIHFYNPAFDVTDAKYITAVVTEKGVVYPPYTENLPKIVKQG
ncbi:MAG: S-methyl-5-thioribose-1-phosphate isomerase [Eubacteriales bacterium]|nr:S-methyl-5-thioribose-1-phosphate isomerase [Eubacteriales bacterium]